MSRRRLQRLNEQLKREISRIVRDDLRDPRVLPLTIADVDVTPDLWVARVYVRVLGSDEERARTLEGLDAAASFIRGRLGRELHIRRVPELRFQIDRSLEHAARIEDVLREVLPGEEGDGEPDVEES